VVVVSGVSRFRVNVTFRDGCREGRRRALPKLLWGGLVVKCKGLLEVRGSHVTHLQWKSGSISETVLDKDVVTTGY